MNVIIVIFVTSRSLKARHGFVASLLFSFWPRRVALSCVAVETPLTHCASLADDKEIAQTPLGQLLWERAGQYITPACARRCGVCGPGPRSQPLAPRTALPPPFDGDILTLTNCSFVFMPTSQNIFRLRFEPGQEYPNWSRTFCKG